MEKGIEGNKMIKKVTTKWLESHGACTEAIQRFKKQNVTEPVELLELMIRSKNQEVLEWANWLIVRILNKKQRVEYARYAARRAAKYAESVNSAECAVWHAARSAEYAAMSAGYAWEAAWYAAECAVWHAALSAKYVEYKKTLIEILKHGIEVVEK